MAVKARVTAKPKGKWRMPPGHLYRVVAATPEGQTAYDNQCDNPECLFQGNPTYKGKQGLPGHITNCVKCGRMLPRPIVARMAPPLECEHGMDERDTLSFPSRRGARPQRRSPAL